MRYRTFVVISAVVVIACSALTFTATYLFGTWAACVAMCASVLVGAWWGHEGTRRGLRP